MGNVVVVTYSILYVYSMSIQPVSKMYLLFLTRLQATISTLSFISVWFKLFFNVTLYVHRSCGSFTVFVKGNAPYCDQNTKSVCSLFTVQSKRKLCIADFNV